MLSHQSSNQAVERDGHKLRLWFPPLCPGRPLLLRYYVMSFRLLLFAMLITSTTHAAEPDWDKLVRVSNEYATLQRVNLEAEYALSSHERWDFDQEKGELVFSNHGVPAVVAKFQFVGSVSTTSHTWLWSWGNSSILPNLSRDIAKVKEYGEKRHFIKLTERKWQAEERDGWEMASITNYLLRGKGIYRPPFSQGHTFLVITDLRRVAK